MAVESAAQSQLNRFLRRRAEDVFKYGRRGLRLTQMSAQQVNQQPFMYDILNKQFGLVNTDGNENGNYLVDPGKAMKKVRRRRKKPAEQASMPKQAMKIDGLGKNTSPAMVGNGMAAPMPQTDYAKGTLQNEFAQRLGKQQSEALTAQKNQKPSTSQNSSSSNTSTTTENGTTTTTTTTGTTSGLISSLSLNGYI